MNGTLGQQHGTMIGWLGDWRVVSSIRWLGGTRVRGLATGVGIVLLIAATGGLSGCSLFGAMAESYKRTSTRPVDAEYLGLAGKSFAVIVAADRGIQGEHPMLVEFLATRIAERLANGANVPAASGFVPAAQVLGYLAKNPAWAAKPMGEIAKELGGVQRVVVVELLEYRLNEPGNAYEWQGNAVFSTTVYEIDGAAPDESAFTKSHTVDFPDQKGVSSEAMDRRVVTTALASRVVDRASWLFYRHEEPYYPDY